jgi:hypothetical protein
MSDPAKMGDVMSAQMEMSMFKSLPSIGVSLLILMSFVLTAMGKGQMVASLWALLVFLAVGYGAYKAFIVDPGVVKKYTTTTCSMPAADTTKVAAA